MRVERQVGCVTPGRRVAGWCGWCLMACRRRSRRSRAVPVALPLTVLWRAIARAAGRHCVTARRSPDRTQRVSAVRRSGRSSICGVRLAGVRSAWRECSVGRRRRSGGCCAGTASRDERQRRGRRPTATSTPLLVSSCISTSSSSVVSGRSANERSRMASTAAPARAGSTCISPSTTTRAMPSRSYAPPRPAATPWHFWSTPLSVSPSAASRCSGS